MHEGLQAHESFYVQLTLVMIALRTFNSQFCAAVSDSKRLQSQNERLQTVFMT